jgi:malate dehydrogenase
MNESLPWARSCLSESANAPLVRSSTTTDAFQNNHRASRNSRTTCAALRFAGIGLIRCVSSNHSRMVGRSIFDMFPAYEHVRHMSMPGVIIEAQSRGKKELDLRKKVTVVGAGNVGANCALRIADKELADVVLVDVVEGIPQGKGLDLLQSGPVQGYDVTITGANDYAPTANSDVAILTAGFPRKPGMSRDDLLLANYEVVRTATEQIARHSPDCILIVVTNPLDAMAQAAYWVSKFPKNRVVGMAGVLDSARFRTFIAAELQVSVENVTGVVMGGHGDTMVPLVRLSGVSGIPLTELMDQATIDRIVDRTANGGAEIVKHLKTGSAYYAPSAAAVEMAESILKDKKKVLPCAAYLEGEYGIHGLFVGVPVKLGAGGIEKIYEIKLTAEEQAKLKKSADSVQELVSVLKSKQ